MSQTIEYYNTNAERFSEETLAIDMEALYFEFLQYLPESGNILDIGCGSGRDTLYFHQKGYNVTAIDNAPKLVELARKTTNLNIQLKSFYEIEEINQYHGIWACASLLHCQRERLPEVLGKIIQALKKTGICYLSFKYGSSDRKKKGRYFTDLNEQQSAKLLSSFSNILLLQQWIGIDQRPQRAEEKWLNIIIQKKPTPKQRITPSANKQIQFISQIQTLLANARSTSTYKFALLISLVRISIEKNQLINDPTLQIQLSDIAEKFIEIYWAQARPYFTHLPNNIASNEKQDQLLKQNSTGQAAIITSLSTIQQKYSSITALRTDSLQWNALIKTVSNTIHKYPLKHLQNMDQKTVEFLYHYDEKNRRSITLLPNVAFCLTQFSIFIEEICQKYWMDNIRSYKANTKKLGNFPLLDEFLFNPSRNTLQKIKPYLLKIQDHTCFYCRKKITASDSEVDHFIPWSLYQYDTAHNFVLADKTCNSKKSNNLAAITYKEKWLARNDSWHPYIAEQIGQYGFLVDRERSESIADNYYSKILQHHGAKGLWQPTQ